MIDSDSEEKDRIVSCRIDNSRIITDILTCLSTLDKRDDICQVEATNQALVFVVTTAGKTTQARTILQSQVFQEYICDEESPILFSLNLNILLDCLQIFGNNSDTTIATMTFSVSLEESGVLTTCEISSMINDEWNSYEFNLFSSFREHLETCRIILQSEALKELMAEIFSVGGGDNTIKIWIYRDMLKIGTSGSADTFHIEIPKTSEIFVLFECDQESAWIYPMNSVVIAMKALNFADETYIRLNTEGMMNVQHQIRSKGVETYADFLLQALDPSILN